MELFKAAQQRSNKPNLFQDYSNRAQRNLTEVKKDNDFIYHERIPDIKNVEAIGKANVAKLLPLAEVFSADFKGSRYSSRTSRRRLVMSTIIDICSQICLPNCCLLTYATQCRPMRIVVMSLLITKFRIFVK